MRTISFHPHEQTLSAPEHRADIAPLRVLPLTYSNGDTAIVSCWQLSWRDLFRLLRTRRVYLAVMGKKHPPVLVVANLEEVGEGLSTFTAPLLFRTWQGYYNASRSAGNAPAIAVVTALYLTIRCWWSNK